PTSQPRQLTALASAPPPTTTDQGPWPAHQPMRFLLPPHWNGATIIGRPTLGHRIRARPMDDLINRTFTAIPCLSCNGGGSDLIKARLAAFWLAAEAGLKPEVPPRSKVMQGCCRLSDELPDAGITILSLTAGGQTTWSGG